MPMMRPSQDSSHQLACVVAFALCCAGAAGVQGAVPAKSAAVAEQHPVLSPDEAITAFRLPDGFQIRLVAAEPDLVNPMTMTLDDDGRIFVSLAHTYRYGLDGTPVQPPSNPVLRLTLGADGRVAQRTVVVSGFSDPVMGLAVRGQRLWATNLTRVFVADLDPLGRAGPRQVIVEDANTPWNPFGMYRLAFGPDGLLYLTVGDHPILLRGPTGEAGVRGNTGGLFRFRPDGSQIELVIQGMRAPFAFDIGPFGRLWVLSNGEGNPNRLIDAIPGADYHFQTRPVDWAWLAGKRPLAPPVWENPPGAHTAVVVYDSNAFPPAYWGNLLVSNWGKHGFPSTHHEIVRHVLDQRGNLVHSEPFLTTTDPRFRPTQIALAPDGNLYVLDWYGQDDENGVTGRLYKVSYVGNRGGQPDASRPGAQPAGGPHASLASRQHIDRRRAGQELLAAGPALADTLARYVAGPDALAAAEALWTLRRSGWPQARPIMERALAHADWRVRRLAIELLAATDGHWSRSDRLLDEADPAVRIEAAMAESQAPAKMVADLVRIVQQGAADDARLRYRAALQVARHGQEGDFETLLSDRNANVRLAGLIALDEAFHEKVRAELARAVLARWIRAPNQVPLLELLAIGQRWPHADLQDALVARLNQDVSLEEFAGGLTILRRLELPPTRATLGGGVERLLGSIVAGKLPLTTPAEKISALEITAVDRPGPHARALLARLMRDADNQVRATAHKVLAKLGAGDAACIELCWQLARDETAPLACRLDAVATLPLLEQQLGGPAWRELLAAPSDQLAMAALRCLQAYRGQAEARQVAASARTDLAARGTLFQTELQFTERALSHPADAADGSAVPAAETAGGAEKQALRKRLCKNPGDPLLGRLAFRRHACARCHLPAGHDVLLGPGLAGVAASNPLEYLVDSILFPSKTIKTGFMTEIVATADGRVLTGKVTRAGNELVVTPAEGQPTRLPLANVADRRRTNRSLMPAGLDATMSETELRDLVAYLATLREPPGGGSKGGAKQGT